MELCLCDSQKEFENCCQKFILKKENLSTCEELMRSRYSAYKLKNIDYLIETTLPSFRKHYSRKSILNWAESVEFIRLEIIESSENEVKFCANYLNEFKQLNEHKEHSRFKFENEKWYYLDGKDF